MVVEKSDSPSLPYHGPGILTILVLTLFLLLNVSSVTLDSETTFSERARDCCAVGLSWVDTARYVHVFTHLGLQAATTMYLEGAINSHVSH
jgi:hypothetical protein